MNYEATLTSLGFRGVFIIETSFGFSLTATYLHDRRVQTLDTGMSIKVGKRRERLVTPLSACCAARIHANKAGEFYCYKCRAPLAVPTDAFSLLETAEGATAQLTPYLTPYFNNIFERELMAAELVTLIEGVFSEVAAGKRIAEITSTLKSVII